MRAIKMHRLHSSKGEKENMWKCRHCKRENHDEGNFCAFCGKRKEEELEAEACENKTLNIHNLSLRCLKHFDPERPRLDAPTVEDTRRLKLLAAEFFPGVHEAKAFKAILLLRNYLTNNRSKLLTQDFSQYACVEDDQLVWLYALYGRTCYDGGCHTPETEKLYIYVNKLSVEEELALLQQSEDRIEKCLKEWEDRPYWKYSDEIEGDDEIRILMDGRGLTKLYLYRPFGLPYSLGISGKMIVQ